MSDEMKEPATRLPTFAENRNYCVLDIISFLYPFLTGEDLTKFMASVEKKIKNARIRYCERVGLDLEEEIRLSNEGAELEDAFWNDTVIYSLYVDRLIPFLDNSPDGNKNRKFSGLQSLFQHFESMNVGTLWLLPILQSPGRDAGFDVSDYKKVRKELFLEDEDQEIAFQRFLDAAHEKNLHILFDVPLNHVSDQHQWFKDAMKGDCPEKDYFIWEKEEPKRYLDDTVRLLFTPKEKSNWHKCEENNENFFHRFYHFQPDLNYRNPNVLLKALDVLLYWAEKGVDGFRLDAIPYLWKVDGTNCENRLGTHLIIKFFRECLVAVNRRILLLAEACQPPKEVVKYFGTGDEVHASFHFPLMPRIFQSILRQNPQPIVNVMHESVTPQIPAGCRWFTFLRCHDELTLEMVGQDHTELFEGYCDADWKRKKWTFRGKLGISARIYDLMLRNCKIVTEDEDLRRLQKILFAYSVLLTLEGTPIIYYGDEFALPNSDAYLRSSGGDSRDLVRGDLEWKWVQEELEKPKSVHNRVYQELKSMLAERKKWGALRTGQSFAKSMGDSILAYTRTSVSKNSKSFSFIHNCSDIPVSVKMTNSSLSETHSFGCTIVPGSDVIEMQRWGFIWMEQTG